MTTTEIEPVIRWIVAERERHLRIAEALVERFWAESRKRIKGPKEEWGYYGVRVRRNMAGVSIQWFRTTFPIKSDGKRTIKNRYLKRGKAHTYSEKAFSGMKPWERELALEIEREARYIRARSEQLSTLAKTVRAYQRESQRYVAQFESTVNEVDYVGIDEDIEAALPEALKGGGE